MNCTHKLIRHNGPHIPGNYTYECPKTGRKFPGEGGIRDTVEAVLQYHLSNPRIFTEPGDVDFNTILERVDCWNCFRLGNPKQFCREAGSSYVYPEPITADKPCSACGGQLVPKYCPTCTAKRLTGYVCQKCGKDFTL